MYIYFKVNLKQHLNHDSFLSFKKFKIFEVMDQFFWLVVLTDYFQ